MREVGPYGRCFFVFFLYTHPSVFFLKNQKKETRTREDGPRRAGRLFFPVTVSSLILSCFPTEGSFEELFGFKLRGDISYLVAVRYYRVILFRTHEDPLSFR